MTLRVYSRSETATAASVGRRTVRAIAAGCSDWADTAGSGVADMMGGWVVEMGSALTSQTATSSSSCRRRPVPAAAAVEETMKM
jgi:hypothetical protein